MDTLKHIAFLHYSCPPVVGGVEEVLYQQASVFHRQDHNVLVITGSGGKFTDQYRILINPLIGSRDPDILSAHRKMYDSRFELDILTDKITDFLFESLVNMDVLIAHNVLTMPYNLPLTLALHRVAESGVIKVVGWNHDSPLFYEEHPQYLYEEPWEIIRVPNPRIHYITISDMRKRQFEDLYGGTTAFTVIPNGIDPAGFFHLDPKVDQLIMENQLFESDLLLLQPSRLHPRKNIELSIKVIRAINELGVKAQLLLTASYDPHEESTFEYFRDLKSLAKESEAENDILFLAEYLIPRDEKFSTDRIILRDLFMIADILFMPSISEGFGIPLLEAGLAKLPIVCSEIPPFREVGGQDVRFFSLEDTPEDIARLILEFTADLPPHRMFRKVINNFLWDNIYRQKLLPLVERITS